MKLRLFLEATRQIDEAPIQDFTTVGDFSKASSFRKRSDRELLTNPRTVQRMKDMFSKTPHPFYFYFVNTPEANRFTEVGKVSREWLDQNMPLAAKEIPDHPDGITIIFTNNKGAQGVPMTPWITAHRIGHVMSRPNMQLGGGRQMQGYDKMVREVLMWTAEILEQGYGVPERNVRAIDSYSGSSDRPTQLLLKNFWQEIGNFRSARNKKFRDYFEMWNELVAQYLITGEITFRELPKAFKANRRTYQLQNQDDQLMMEELNQRLEAMASYVEGEMDRLFNEAGGQIFVM